MDARRPLKTRSAEWAKKLARWLTEEGVTPNLISVLSVVFALLGALCFLGTSHEGASAGSQAFFFFAAALCIQLRLICNMMDGMVAVEGGKGTPNGNLYNEVPDRLADLILLAAAGMWASSAGGVSLGCGSWLGWLAGALAILTACVRMQGAALTGEQDFGGPMGKSQRMTILTVLCLLMMVGVLGGIEFNLFGWGLGVIVFGEVWTLKQRLSRLSKRLERLAQK